MKQNRVLGKGLSALLSGSDLKGAPVISANDLGVSSISIDAIGFNSEQPRKFFDSSKLEELAASIKQVGILQPVLVRRLNAGEKVLQHPESSVDPAKIEYCVVAGERRVRASRLAELPDVSAIVVSYEENEALKVALLENIQREDLGPVEEADAYRNLMDSYGATQEELAEMLGKKRSSVANMLRILTLERDILGYLQEGKITRGHAKALLGLPPGVGRISLAKLCHSRGLSVRECERRVQSGGSKPQKKSKSSSKKSGNDDPGIKVLVERAEQTFGTPVVVDRDPKDGKGSVSIRFFSDSDLIRILKVMGVDTDLG